MRSFAAIFIIAALQAKWERTVALDVVEMI